MSQTEDKPSNVSRRGMLKWAGALAAVGVVGVGLGLGGDMLVRPNTTNTATSTLLQTESVTLPAVTQTATQTNLSTATVTSIENSTQTVTQPAVTQTVTTTNVQTSAPLSYVAPLSPSVLARVNQIIQGLVDAHKGETYMYQAAYAPFGNGPGQVVIKNGVPIGVIPEDLIHPTIAREDAYVGTSISLQEFQAGHLRGIPWGHSWVYPWQISGPNRVTYPMLRTGPRGDPNNAQFVRITWDEAIKRTVAAIQNCKTKYGNYSVETGGVCNGHSEPFLISYGVQCSGGWGCASSANQMLASALVG